MSTKKRILIVEDEPEIANLIRMHMDRNGFAADMVHSGKAGIVEIEQNMPDCVLLDLMLPDLDGLEVCRRLRRAPKTENLPIIIVSAKGEEADVVAERQASCRKCDLPPGTACSSPPRAEATTAPSPYQFHT